MKNTIKVLLFMLALVFTVSGCVATKPLVVDPGTVLPGSKVTRNGVELGLIGEPIQEGHSLPETALVDAFSMVETDLRSLKGSILILSIVPSIDTQVCEEQTHYLGEEGDSLPSTIKRMTISRDTPFAQKRFAKQAKLEDISYFSDYKEGNFGRSTGLLLDGPMLLARSVIVVDKKGIVRYIQVVPEITNLPDMDKAFSKAKELLLE